MNHLLAQHLLSVQINLEAKKFGTVQLNFKYLTHLEVVVVNVKLAINKDVQVYTGDKEVYVHMYKHYSKRPRTERSV